MFISCYFFLFLLLTKLSFNVYDTYMRPRCVVFVENETKPKIKKILFMIIWLYVFFLHFINMHPLSFIYIYYKNILENERKNKEKNTLLVCICIYTHTHTILILLLVIYNKKRLYMYSLSNIMCVIKFFG